MKRVMSMVALVAFCLAMGGCAFVAPVIPPTGMFVSAIKGPISTDMKSTPVASKRGESSSLSILGLFAFGDASVQAAASNGGLTRIEHVDYEYTNVFFIYQRFATVVYGE